MKKIKNLEFEKSITRDWGIIYAQLWHKVFTQKFKQQTGWGYSEVIFEGKDNTISVYRAPEEHINGMRNHIIKEINKNDKWLLNHFKELKKDSDLMIKWIKRVKKKKMSNYNNEELVKIANDFMRRNIDIGPRFIMALWFPIQMEKHELLKKYKKQINLAVETRDYVAEIGPLADEFGRKLGQEVAQRADLSQTLSRFIAYEETLDYFKKNTIVNVNVLKKRQKYFIVTNDGILYEKIDKYINKNNYRLKTEKVKDVSVIKGNVAMKGKIKGEVKLVGNKDMFNKFKQGDILVTGMTTPDFLPIMKKAGAIITDEGGITCHAAIVSRELKKPCIIGTKIATQILKDGDMVEVDANKGIIRKLK